MTISNKRKNKFKPKKKLWLIHEGKIDSWTSDIATSRFYTVNFFNDYFK